MIRIPLKLERIVKFDDNLLVLTEIDTEVAIKGGSIINKEKTLRELLYNTVSEQILTLRQLLEND